MSYTKQNNYSIHRMSICNMNIPWPSWFNHTGCLRDWDRDTDKWVVWFDVEPPTLHLNRDSANGLYTLHGTGTGTGTGNGMGTIKNNDSLSLSLCSVYST